MKKIQIITTQHHLENAFSLVEMVISIVIVALLASVSILSFSSTYSNAQLDNTTQRLLADLKLTRQQAIQDQTSYLFEINPESHYYKAPRVKELSGINDIYLDMSHAPYKSTHVALSLNDSGNNIIEFGPQGYVSNYGTILLTDGDQKRFITITARGEIDATP